MARQVNQMKTLRFIIDNQIIRKDPTCDFSNLVPGTKGYLIAEFSFSKEWDGMAKVAGFYSPLGREYPPRVLADGKTCVIPFEALEKRIFKVQVIGQSLDQNLKLKTNKVVVYQNGGKV